MTARRGRRFRFTPGYRLDLMKILDDFPPLHWIREDDGTVRPEKDIRAWGDWYHAYVMAGKHVVEQTSLEDPQTGKPVVVSTIFLGMDHGLPYIMRPEDRAAYLPLVFETMIFGGRHNEDRDKYPTEELARAGHKKAVELLLSTNGKAHD
jgi:hypothetical protein